MAELAIVAVRAIDRAHAPRTQNCVALIGPEVWQNWRPNGRERPAPGTITGQQPFHFYPQARISSAGGLQVFRALFERRVKQVFNLTIASPVSLSCLNLAWPNLG